MIQQPVATEKERPHLSREHNWIVCAVCFQQLGYIKDTGLDGAKTSGSQLSAVQRLLYVATSKPKKELTSLRCPGPPNYSLHPKL